jgi:pSer/pThr/pTyr-binding forkhead associated (FHA) protein
VSDSLLTILKFFLIALLWLFFLRVLRAVWSELKRPPVVTVADEPRPRRTRRREAPAPTAPPGPPRIDGRGGNGQVMRLRVLEPADGRGRIFELGDEVTVGRAAGCGVPLDDAFTSQLHARVFRRDGEMWIEDLGSTNGTFVNAKKLGPPTPLHPGDRLQVGRTVLEASP